MPKGNTTATARVFDALADTSAEADLKGRAAVDEPKNFLTHAVALSLTKTADGLVDPKLVLSWLLNALGAGGVWIGLLVPVRESLALLPQPLIAAQMETVSHRKWFWAFGSAVQGVSVLGIFAVAFFLQGSAAGLAIVSLLAVLATARAFCSTSYKDVLGKTVAKSRRGTATGAAGSISAVAVIVFAVALIIVGDARMAFVLGALLMAAVLWLTASALFTTLSEPASEVTRADLGDRVSDQLTALRENPQLGLFVAIRAALVGTALSPPFLIMLAGGGAEDLFAQLGALVLASALAALVSSYVWGRLSDQSSKVVLTTAGLTGGAALILALVLSAVGWLSSVWVAPVVLFLLMLAHNGVRSGRSTHLVDMAPEGQRAAYTAASNLVIGVWLVAFGALAAALASFGAVYAVSLCAVSCLLGSALATRLDKVQ